MKRIKRKKDLTNRRSRPALAPQFHHNHYVFARRLGSTLAPGTNIESNRTVYAEGPKRINQDTRAANNPIPSIDNPTQGIFQREEVTSEE